MKLQYMIIIFAIIIIPITLLLSIYIQSQTDSIALQTKYDTMLLDATYDAVVAFQSNTLNNEKSSDKDTLRENISASINTFTNSLSNNLGVGGYTKEYLMPYVPAIAYTLYDGLYIYSPINNLKTEVNADGTTYVSSLDYEHVLKPYIYYSERIVQGNIDVVINYSLDNYITVYGKVGSENIVKSGYLVADTKNVEPEILSENVSIYNEYTKETNIESYKYVYSTDHEKIYLDENDNKLFKVIDYHKNDTFGPKQDIVDDNGNIETREITTSNFMDYSAKVYYAKARKFTEEINEKLGNYIQAKNTKLLNIPTKSGEDGKNIEDGNSSFFLNISSNNDPEDESSAFVQHKRKVIKVCIEENLNNAISSYNSQSGKKYNFKMPKITEYDWEQIYRNVSVISFLQGIPSGLKQYNNYSVVTSTGNKEYIDTNSIYFIGNDGSYHNKECTKLEGNNLIGYPKYDFNQYRRNYNSSEFYYKHNKNETEYIPACYYCIVDSTQETNPDNVDNQKLKAYYTAIARERYNLIKTTQNLK